MTTTPPVYEDPVAFEDEEIALSEYFHTLWFHRRLLFSTAFFLIGAGIIVLLQITPKYTASSSIMIGVPKTKIVDIEEVLSAGLGNDSAINGEIEVLRSRELAKKIIKRFNLLAREEFNPSLRTPGLMSRFKPTQWIPDDWKESLGQEPPVERSAEEIERRRMVTATNIFLNMLKISPIGKSNVLRISFESTNPKLAATLANELPEAYIIGQMEAKFQATEKATKWLDAQLSELKDKVAASEQAVELYKEEHELTEFKGTGILNSQISEINSQLVIAKAERRQAEARLGQIRQLMSRSASDIESASEVLASSLIQRLQVQQAEVTRKFSEMSVEYGPKHPKILQVNAEINDIRNKIKLEIQKIVNGLKNEVELARSKELSLSLSLEEIGQQAGKQKKESIQLHALEREASANRTLFETFLNRFKETSTSTGMEEADARVISKAEIPTSSSSPKKKQNLVLIVVGAFVVSIALVFLVQVLHQGLLSPEQIENELGLPAIGMIPSVSSKNPHDYVLEKPHSSFGEALNSLRTSLVLSDPDEAVKVIQITSSLPEEGKSTLAIAFGRLMARSGKKVLLVDGDLRRASLEKKLGVSAGSKGLTDLLMSPDETIEGFGFKDEKSDLFIMPKGKAEYVNATDVFSSRRIQNIISSLKSTYDYVIIDSPPIMAVSDARLIAKLVDKTVFVVHWDKTPRKVIKAAVHQLKESNGDIAGCVLQQVNLKRYGKYGYGDSGHYYHYGRYGHYYTS